MKEKFFSRIDLPILLIICSILLSIYLILTTSAKYTSVNGMSSNSKIALWDPDAQADVNNVTVVAGSDAISYDLTVSSNSDVSSNYSITLSNIPSDVRVSIDGGAEQTPVSGTITFLNAGTFTAGSGITERTHTFTFRAPLEASAINNNSISVNVAFSQLD